MKIGKPEVYYDPASDRLVIIKSCSSRVVLETSSVFTDKPVVAIRSKKAIKKDIDSGELIRLGGFA